MHRMPLTQTNLLDYWQRDNLTLLNTCLSCWAACPLQKEGRKLLLVLTLLRCSVEVTCLLSVPFYSTQKYYVIILTTCQYPWINWSPFLEWLTVKNLLAPSSSVWTCGEYTLNVGPHTYTYLENLPYSFRKTFISLWYAVDKVWQKIRFRLQQYILTNVE